MTMLSLLLIVLAFLVGYLLGKIGSQHESSDQLDAIHSALEELTNNLCGDKALEKAIEETNDVGATMDEEMLAYQGGSLPRIEEAIRALARQVERASKDKS